MTTRIEICFRRSNIDNTVNHILANENHTLTKKFPTAQALEVHLFEALIENFPDNEELELALPLIQANLHTLVVPVHKGLIATIAIFPAPKIAGDNLELQPGVTLMNQGSRVAEGHDKLQDIDRDIPGHSIWRCECSLLIQL
jgi:hypothetical protein